MKITYLGQCGFLLEGKHTRIVTDPYLSDSVDRLYFSEQTPWRRLYPAPATLDALRPDGVLISHDHGDHMDPDTIRPYIAAGGEAVFAAPAPVCGELKEMGVSKILPARAEHPFILGEATVCPIACAHTQLHTTQDGMFCELSYLIDFGNDERVFFGGDFSLYDGIAARLKRARPSLMLLPANGRDADRTARGIVGNVTAEEAAALAAEVGAPWIPMHRDLYAINRCSPEEPETASRRYGVRLIQPALMQTIQVGREQDA